MQPGRWTLLCIFVGVASVPIGAAFADTPSFWLTVRNHQFEPTDLEIPADTKIALVVTNADATPEEFESIELHREKVVAGGQAITVFIGPLRPGRYEFFGDFHPDSARGHIVVK